MCPTEEMLERFIMTGRADTWVEEHLLCCPVWQDTIPQLTSEIAEMKGTLLPLGTLDRRRLRLERRREERHLTAKPVTVLAEGRTICEGILRDRSNYGVCLFVPVPLHVGDHIQIKDEDQTPTGSSVTASSVRRSSSVEFS
jgi:hypothetical protein